LSLLEQILNGQNKILSYFEYLIPKFYENTLFLPIRDKYDCIYRLLNSIKIMITNKPNPHSHKSAKKFIVFDNSLKRIFYFNSDKYYSITFPFSVQKKNNDICDFEIKYQNNYTIDSYAISILESFLENIQNSQNTDDLSNYLYSYCNGDDDGFEYERFNLALFLLTNEYGYLRYNHDPQNYQEGVHPLNHIDINYTNNSSFKFGLNQKINHVEFIDLININTNCYFLGKFKKKNK